MKRDLFLCTFAEDALNIIKEFGIGMESNHFCISERLDDHVVEETISEVNRDMRFCDIDDLRKVFVHGPFTEIYPQAIDHLMTETGRKRLDSAFEALEMFADRFALSLLMPRHELKSFSDAGVNTLMTVWAFDVSETALLNRLHWLESDSLTTNRQPSEFFRNLLK